MSPSLALHVDIIHLKAAINGVPVLAAFTLGVAMDVHTSMLSSSPLLAGLPERTSWLL